MKGSEFETKHAGDAQLKIPDADKESVKVLLVADPEPARLIGSGDQERQIGQESGQVLRRGRVFIRREGERDDSVTSCPFFSHSRRLDRGIA